MVIIICVDKFTYNDIIKPMPKRGRKKKIRLNFNLQKETVLSILSLLLLAFSLVSFISFFAPNYAVNSFIQSIFRKSFGYASILIPLILTLFGLLFIEKVNTKFKEGRLVIGLILFIVSLSSFLHLFVSNENSLKIAGKGNAGGYFGHYFTFFLKNTVSTLGAVTIILIGFLASVLLIFDLSLIKLFSFVNFKDFGKGFFSFFSKKQKHISRIEDADVVLDILDKDYSILSNTTDDDVKVSNDRNIKKPLVIKPTIEIIPTMSEPQNEPRINSNKNLDSILNISQKTPLGLDKIWSLPPVDLLYDPVNENLDVGNTKERAKIIKDKLRIQGIGSEIVDIKVGPTVTQYEIKPNNDVKIARIMNMDKDLAAALSSSNGLVRIQAPIPGTPYVGIEVPNVKRATVSFKSLITSGIVKSMKSKIAIVLGKDVGGQVYAYDIGNMPHLLVAGATGSGKSIFIHNILFSILYRASPQEVKFILIDPKRVELTLYNNIPHLLTPVVTDMEKAPSVFKWAVSEMENRYKKFEDARVQNIDAYNEKAGFQSMPYIIIIVDEFSDIIIQDPAGVEKSVVRLAALARATGIHLVLALQRPTTEVITGLIKANIPAKIAFNVSSNIDSRVIIDQTGAEKLLGKGDMLFVNNRDSSKPIRLQGAFVSPGEIDKLTSYLKSQGVAPEFKDEVLSMSNNGVGKSGGAFFDDVDELFDQSSEIVISAGKASASLLQTKLSIGYARAARILQQLEERGIVGPAQGSKPRDVLQNSIPKQPLQIDDNLTSLNIKNM